MFLCFVESRNWSLKGKECVCDILQKWNKKVAKAAQSWALKCKFLIHDNVTGRYIDKYGVCGQNIFVATHKVPW